MTARNYSQRCILSAFAGLWNGTISFAMSVLSVCPSVLPSAWRNSAPTGRIFMKIDIWNFFWKSGQKIQVLLKSDKNSGYFSWRPTVYIWQHLAHFFLECEIFQTKSAEKITTHILRLISCRLCDNVEEWPRTGQAKNDKTVHLHFMLNT